MHFKSLADWMRAPGGRQLDIKRFDILELKSTRITREQRFRALYNEWERRKAEGYTHKIWVALSDQTTRHEHRAANGQRVPIDEMFNVGGEDLLLPSDVTASFEQTANCRCKVSYVRVGRAVAPDQPDSITQPADSVIPPPLPLFGQTKPILPSRFRVNLNEHEGGTHFGHTIRDHVGKSDSQLRRLLETPRARGAMINSFRPAHGTFSSIQEGNKWVGAALNRYRDAIEQYLNGNGRERFTFNAVFASRTGREAYRPEKYSARIVHRRLSAVRLRDTIAVRVVLVKSNLHPWGFTIETAFPFSP